MIVATIILRRSDMPCDPFDRAFSAEQLLGILEIEIENAYRYRTTEEISIRFDYNADSMKVLFGIGGE